MPTTSTYPVTVEGLLVTGANTGTAQLRFRSETIAVTTCKTGFALVVEKNRLIILLKTYILVKNIYYVTRPYFNSNRN